MKLIKPMNPILKFNIQKGKEWIHQVKWDGIRGITYIYDGSLRVFTKNGNERTVNYPDLSEIINLCDVQDAVLDGEIIVLDDNDRPSFKKALSREKLKSKDKIKYYSRKHPIKYIVFDILFLNGKDLTKLPLYKRKEVLYKTLKKSENITITDDFEDGDSLYKIMKEKNWEGIVSKKIDSEYISGKNHNAWFKTKIEKKMFAVICGVVVKNDFLKSLVLGIYKEDKLQYIGKVYTGLKTKDFNLIKENLSSLKQEKNPFLDLKLRDNIIWLKPVLTCWVSYMEITENGHLRHPKLLGFSSEEPNAATGKEIIE